MFEQNYVECECRRLGDFAAFVPPGYSWTLPAPIVCGIVVVSQATAITNSSDDILSNTSSSSY